MQDITENWNLKKKSDPHQPTPWSERDGLMVPDTTLPPAVLHFLKPHTTYYGLTGRIDLKPVPANQLSINTWFTLQQT